jgi:hypothetical protein
VSKTLPYLEAIAASYPSSGFDPEWTLDQLRLEEIDRSIHNYLVASVAASYRHWERHADKSFRYRQLDVKWSRRIMYAYIGSLRQNYGVIVPQEDLEPSPAQRMAGARIVWTDWWGSHRPWLRARAGTIARWALKYQNDWEGRALVQGLEDEHDRLVVAFRGIDGLSRELSRLNQVDPRSKRGLR